MSGGRLAALLRCIDAGAAALMAGTGCLLPLGRRGGVVGHHLHGERSKKKV